jgi:hypothetical protein
MKHFTCSKELYCSFLQVTCQRYSALTLSEVSPTALSHDAISDWLAATKCQPKDIWEAAKNNVLSDNQKGIIIADETIIDKSRSDKIELTSWQYSGAEHEIIKGIGVLNFLWHADGEEVIPMDYRIYQPPEDGKTKNDHFREMLILSHKRGIKPEAIVADSWYSSLNNVKLIRDIGWIWIMGLRKNRIVNRGVSLESLTIPEEGLRVHLRGYGWITVYRFVAKNGRTDYIGTNMDNASREEVECFVKRRWNIEVFHRELKQTCGLQNCQSRTGRAQRNHIGFSILTWIRRARIRSINNFSFYQQNWNIIKNSIAQNLKMQLLYSSG